MALAEASRDGAQPARRATARSASPPPCPGGSCACSLTRGARSTPGQGLVVIEAMKMENELKAPRDGTRSRDRGARRAGGRGRRAAGRRGLKGIQCRADGSSSSSSSSSSPPRSTRCGAHRSGGRASSSTRSPATSTGRSGSKRLRFRALPAEVEVLGLRVDGADPDAPPFLEVPSARIRPSLAPAARQPHRPLAGEGRGTAPADQRLPGPARRPRGRRHPEARRRAGRPRRGPPGEHRTAGDRGRRVRPQPRAGAPRPRPAEVHGSAGRPPGGRGCRPRLLRPGGPSVRRRADAARGDPDRPRAPPGPPHRPGGTDRRGEDERRLPWPAPAFRPTPGPVHSRGSGRPRRPRAPHLPLRARPGRDGELERASLRRRLPPAHRGPGPRHRRHLPDHGRAPLRDLALLRRHLGPAHARSRRRGTRWVGLPGRGRAADEDRASGPRSRVDPGGRRRGHPADALRMG